MTRRRMTMESTGIIKKIDRLGRMVIPKSLCKQFAIKEESYLEIIADREEVRLRKYSPVDEINRLAAEYAEIISESTGFTVCITDREKIIAISGKDNVSAIGKEISSRLELVMEKRRIKILSAEECNLVQITEQLDHIFKTQIVSPIINEGDIIGAVLFMSRENRRRCEVLGSKLAVTASSFLQKQIEQ